MIVKQCSPLAGYLELKSGIDSAVMRVLSGGAYILGREVAAFEEEFAAWNGSGFAVGCASGTDALELILRALHLPEKSLVLTSANTAAATAAAVMRAGCRVCFAEVDGRSMNLTPESVREALCRAGGRVKAVIAVHLFGNPAPVDELAEVCAGFGVPLIEDCAQATGARIGGKKVGNFGIAGAFSFYPTKNLGAFGDGGLVTVNDPALAEELKLMRQYGWKVRYESSCNGINSRLDELQAAILRVKLPHLDAANLRRIELAGRYYEKLRGCSGIVLPCKADNAEHVYHQFVIQCAGRDEKVACLAESGIATMVHYPVPLHRQKAYISAPRLTSLEITEKVTAEIISLPIYPELPPEAVDYVSETLSKLL